MKSTNVVAAIIKKDNEFLIVQRNKNKHLGLKWEFPGGKVDENESFESALKRLSTNFYFAVRPQITKSYSSSNLIEMKTLVFQSSKLAYCLLLILSIPFYLEIDKILHIWLKDVPEFVEIFCKLSILFIEALIYQIKIFQFSLINLH